MRPLFYRLFSPYHGQSIRLKRYQFSFRWYIVGIFQDNFMKDIQGILCMIVTLLLITEDWLRFGNRMDSTRECYFLGETSISAFEKIFCMI